MARLVSRRPDCLISFESSVMKIAASIIRMSSRKRHLSAVFLNTKEKCDDSAAMRARKERTMMMVALRTVNESRNSSGKRPLGLLKCPPLIHRCGFVWHFK